MTLQENEAIARADVELYNKRDLDGIAALFSPNAEITDVATGQMVRGPQGAREDIQAHLAAFPDSKSEIIRIVAGERSAAVEYWARGTHTGPMVTPSGTIPPTGRKIEMRLCDVMEIQDGKITHLTVYWDLYSLMNQLGLIPEAARS